MGLRLLILSEDLILTFESFDAGRELGSHPAPTRGHNRVKQNSKIKKLKKVEIYNTGKKGATSALSLGMRS